MALSLPSRLLLQASSLVIDLHPSPKATIETIDRTVQVIARKALPHDVDGWFLSIQSLQHSAKIPHQFKQRVPGTMA